MPQVTSRNRFLLASLAVLALILFTTQPLFAQNKADLSKLVVVGDSLSAGYQNGSLLGSQQVNGYASLIAKQARVPLVLPLIAFPGVPQVLQLDASTNPPTVEPVKQDIPAMPRTNPSVQATDLAVPGATVFDALYKVPFAADTPDYVMTNLVLGFPGVFAQPYPVLMTQVQSAQALHPTTIILWIGNNDALGAATNGNANVTPITDFTASYAGVIDALNATGAKLVVANIPDVTSIPFLVPVPKLEAQLGLQPGTLMAIGLQPGDFVTLDHVSDVVAILMGDVSKLPLADNAVLTANEAATVSQAVDAYNAIIASEAKRVGAALVDINALFKQIVARGYVVNGRRITADFLGGVFSLDGVHPTNTGYAVVANEFIKTMNRVFAAGIPPVAVAQIAKSDLLILPGVGHPPKALNQGALDGMRKVLGH